MTINSEQSAPVTAHLLESIEVKRKVIDSCVDSILAAAQAMGQSLRAGGKILLCGNGGSAADCQHWAGEFMCRLSKDFERPALPAIALTTDTSFLTAFSNDYGFENVFERQVQALGKPGDVLIGITTSGNSANVLRAVKAARALNMHTIAMMGESGEMAQWADIVIAVPSHNTQHIQESHLAIYHILVALVERDVLKKTLTKKQENDP